jgi:hypothetical protein
MLLQREIDAFTAALAGGEFSDAEVQAMAATAAREQHGDCEACDAPIELDPDQRRLRLLRLLDRLGFIFLRYGAERLGLQSAVRDYLTLGRVVITENGAVLFDSESSQT